MDKKSRNKEWRPTLGEILFAVVIAIIPWSFPTMGIIARCVLWFGAWLIFLHLAFSLIPYLSDLRTFVKVGIAVGITAFGSIAAYTPIVDMWRDEMANALTGRFRPRGDTHKREINFQIGPNAKAEFTWTGTPNSMEWGNMGTFIRLRRDNSGDLIANTIIRDHDGRILVEIIDNEWRISSAAWEKNYTDDALEVKDARGKIVFQIRLLPDRAEFQAEWWDEYGNGIRLVQLADRPDSPESDRKGFVIIKMNRDVHPDEPTIQPIFKYPSKKYFGEFR